MGLAPPSPLPAGGLAGQPAGRVAGVQAMLWAPGAACETWLLSSVHPELSSSPPPPPPAPSQPSYGWLTPAVGCIELMQCMVQVRAAIGGQMMF